jgi:hypothetical protein
MSFHFHLLMILKVFQALGNDRPQILVQLEDCVIQAIISISEGKLRENAMETLYSQLLSLEKDLVNDSKALAWFRLATASSATPSTPRPSSAGMSI